MSRELGFTNRPPAPVPPSAPLGLTLVNRGGPDPVWQETPRVIECIVNSNGTEDYVTIGQAITAGCTRICVRAGTYTESSNIVIPNGGAIIGESVGAVTINLTGGASLNIDGSGGTKETAGTISVANASNAIVGVGTTFTNLSAGQFIRLGQEFYEIATITNATNIVLTRVYQGIALTGESYVAQAMFTAVELSNLILSGSSSTGLFIRAARISSFEDILVRDCTPNIRFEDSNAFSISGVTSNNSTGNGVEVASCYAISINALYSYNASSVALSLSGDCQGVIIDSSVLNNSNSTGVDVGDTCTNINLTDCIITNNNGKGINSTPGTGFIIMNACTVQQNGDDGIDFDGGTNTVNDCIIDSNAGFGIEAGNGGIIQGNFISNNTDNGVSLMSDNDVTVTGNQIVGNTGKGVNCNQDREVISGNIIRDNTEEGIDVGNSSSEIVITNNVIENNTLDGISMSGDDCIINANRSCSNGGDGVIVNAQAGRCIVTSNSLQGNTGTSFVDNSGTTVSANNVT